MKKPNLSFFRRQPKSDGRACEGCGQVNQPPFLFCEECGKPLLGLSKWRITTFLSIAFTVFLGTWVFTEPIDDAIRLGITLFPWDWPIFVFYNLLFVQFAFWMISGVPRLRRRFLVWYPPFFLVFMIYFDSVHRTDQGSVLTFILTETPELARGYPLIFFPILGMILALIFVPAFLRWKKRYGWVHSYRLVLLTLIATVLACFGGFEVIEWLYYRDPVRFDSYAGIVEVQPDYQHHFGLAAVSLTRILIFEIFIYAALSSYARARRARLGTDRQRLAGQSGFEKAAVAIAVHLRRLVLTLENTVLYILKTLRELAIELAQIFYNFLMEIFLPFVAMFVAQWFLYLLTLQTVAYIVGASWRALGWIMLAVTALLSSLMIFYGAKGRLGWKRVAHAQWQLIGWLLPNLMLFFLLLSVSLFATGRAMTDPETADTPLPYQIGPLSIAVAGILAILVLTILIRKRGELHVVEEDAEPAAAATEPEPASQRARTGQGRPRKPSRFGKMKQRVGQVAEETRVGDHYRHLRGQTAKAAKTFGDRARGKPALVDRLEQIQQEHATRTAQLESLETLKGSLAPETYHQRRLEIASDLKRLDRELQETLTELSELRMQSERECETLREKVRKQKQRLKEIETMEQAEVIDAKQARDQARAARTELDTLEPKLNAVERRLAFLEPLAEQAPAES